VKGVVDTIDVKGAVIRLEEGIEGYLRAADLSRDFVEDARNVLQSGAEIEARVTSIDRKTRRITLSVKALEMEIEGKAIEEYTTRSSTTISLGDKLKEEWSKRET
jgi:small subunit ribosomal protein S1